MGQDKFSSASPWPVQFGLRAVFAVTTLWACTLFFVLWRGPAAVVMAFPLASSCVASWCCLRAGLRADSLAVRLWFLLGAGLCLGMLAVAVTVTLTW